MKVIYNAGSFEEEFGFEFLDSKHPGDISFEIFSHENNDGGTLGFFTIYEAEILGFLKSNQKQTSLTQRRCLFDPLSSNGISTHNESDSKSTAVLFRFAVLKEIDELHASFVRLFQIDNILSFQEKCLLHHGFILTIVCKELIGIVKEEHAFLEGLVCSRGNEVVVYNLKLDDTRSYAGEFQGWRVSVPSKLTDIHVRTRSVSLQLTSKSEYLHVLHMFQSFAPNASIEIDPNLFLALTSVTTHLKKEDELDLITKKDLYEESLTEFSRLDKCVTEHLYNVECLMSKQAKVLLEWVTGKVDCCESVTARQKQVISKPAFAKSSQFARSSQFEPSSKPKGESHKKKLYYQVQAPEPNVNKSIAFKGVTSSLGESACSCSYCLSRQELMQGFSSLNCGDYLEAYRHAQESFKLLRFSSAECSENHKGHSLLLEKLNLIKQISLNDKMFRYAQTGNLEMLRKSLEQGAEIDSVIGQLQWIEGKGLFTTSPFLRGFTVVHFAVMPFLGAEKQSKLQCLKYIFKLGCCPIRSRSEDGRLAVHVAVREISCLRYLIEEAKQNPNIQDSVGRTALHHAALFGR